MTTFFTSAKGSAEVIPLPAREFVVEVTYVMRTRHVVHAASAQEAEHLAPDAALLGELEVVDIVDARAVRENYAHERA